MHPIPNTYGRTTNMYTYIEEETTEEIIGQYFVPVMLPVVIESYFLTGGSNGWGSANFSKPYNPFISEEYNNNNNIDSREREREREREDLSISTTKP